MYEYRVRVPKLLVLLLATVLVSACSVVEPAEAEVEHPERCALVQPGMPPNPTTPRFHHYRTNIDMGDPLPSSVSSRGGSATRTWVGRAQRTARVESGVTGLSFLLVPQIAGMIIGGIMLLVFAILVLERNRQQPAGAPMRTPAEHRRYIARFALVTFATLLVAGLSGYFAGSVVSIDNPTASPIEIVLDGHAVPLAPRSFIDQRVWGTNVDIEIRANGQLVEAATMHLDDGPADAIVRAMFGGDRYVYAVCGLNSYTLQTARYGR
jgi:hypothetical protein